MYLGLCAWKYIYLERYKDKGAHTSLSFSLSVRRAWKEDGEDHEEEEEAPAGLASGGRSVCTLSHDGRSWNRL